MAASAARTNLQLAPEAQALFRLIGAAGRAGYETAVLLLECRFDQTMVALAIGLEQGCKACAKGRNHDALRGCPRHRATVRQRVKRTIDRMSALVPGFHVPELLRRPRVVYGADGRFQAGGSGGEGSFYETVGREDEQLEAVGEDTVETIEEPSVL